MISTGELRKGVVIELGEHRTHLNGGVGIGPEGDNAHVASVQVDFLQRALVPGFIPVLASHPEGEGAFAE